MGWLLDIGLVVWVNVAVYVGFSRGLYREVVRFGLAVLALCVAWLGRSPMQWLMVNAFSFNYLVATVLAFPAFFILLDLGGTAFAVAVEREMRWDRPDPLKRVQGAIFGGARGALAAFIVVAALAFFPLPGDPCGASAAVFWTRHFGLGESLVMTGPYSRSVAALARINRTPAGMRALAGSPEVQAIARSPQVQAVMGDPAVRELLKRRDAAALLAHPRVKELLASSEFQERVRSLDVAAIEQRLNSDSQSH